MNPSISKLKSILPRPFIYCDVGARWGIEEPWKSFKDVIALIGFEPDKEEYLDLLHNKGAMDSVYPYALYRESGKVCINLTRSRGCSSLYRPNFDFLNCYPDPERYEVEDSVSVEATTIDALYEKSVLTNVDFIKIDVQGAELDILTGGESFLNKNILGLEIEVEFQPLYRDQPMFSDVDAFARRKLGLQMQDLRKTYWKYKSGINVGASKGQLIFGDALYFRSPYSILEWSSRFNKDEAKSKIQMACFMGLVYGYLDYGLCILDQPSIKDFLEDKCVKDWKNLIYNYGKCIKYNGKGAGKLAALFNLLHRAFQPTHGGWASIGHHLGSRKKYNIFT